MIKLVGTIDFPTKSPNIFYSTFSRDVILYPDPDANTYHLKDLFQIGNINMTEIKELGGVVELIMNWNCHIDDTKCKPQFEVKFINQINSINPLHTPLGYFIEKSIAYNDKRDYVLNIGIKFKLISRGVAKSFNLYNLIIQVWTYKKEKIIINF